MKQYRNKQKQIEKKALKCCLAFTMATANKHKCMHDLKRNSPNIGNAINCQWSVEVKDKTKNASVILVNLQDNRTDLQNCHTC